MQGMNPVTKGIKPVILEKDKCNGCVSCMKRCPTEAIRIFEGKATIKYERCVGCGECVKICPTHAKHENYDSFEVIKNYKYKIALPSPSIYGQFNHLTDVNYILTGLKKIGFDEVFEVGVGAELVSAATRKYIAENKTKPLISSSCPAILNLILMRYEHLVDNVSPLLPPEVVSAKLALKRAMDTLGLKREEIGIFSISPCAAMVAELKKYPALVDGVLAFKEVYFPLLAEMNKLQTVEKLTRVGKLGLSWGSSTGEAVGINTINFISADGMENVFNVLNELEHEKLNSIDFLELNACPSGCVGGTMNIENPFLARARLRRLRSLTARETAEDYKIDDLTEFIKREPYVQNNVFKLDDDRLTAMKKLIRVKEIYAKLPQIDCGNCGAPRCMAYAEDYVLGIKRKCKYCEVNFDAD